MSSEKNLRAMSQRPDNRRCFNCGTWGCTYVVPNVAIFVCTECSGHHMSIGHRVKSLSMGKFTAEEVAVLDAGGNAAASRTWLGTWKPEGDACRPLDKNPRKLDAWVRTVFLDKRYFCSTPAAQQRAVESDQIPTRPLSEVLGGGPVKLTVSPQLSPRSSPGAAPPPAATATKTTAPGPSARFAASPATSSPPAVGAPPRHTQAAADAPLGFTDNAFGPPPPSTAPATPATSSPSAAAANSFDPFGAFVAATPSEAVALPGSISLPPAVASTSTPAPLPAMAVAVSARVPSFTFPGPPPPSSSHTQAQRLSGGGAGGQSASGITYSRHAAAAGSAALPSPSSPQQQQRQQHQAAPAGPASRFGLGGGFNDDDVDWGAFAAAPSPPPPAAPASISAAMHPPAQVPAGGLSHTAPAPAAQQSQQSYLQAAARAQAPAGPRTSSGGGAASMGAGTDGGGGGGGLSASGPGRPASATAPRAELPSDLFSEPTLTTPMAGGGGVGAVLGGAVLPGGPLGGYGAALGGGGYGAGYVGVVAGPHGVMGPGHGMPHFAGQPGVGEGGLGAYAYMGAGSSGMGMGVAAFLGPQQAAVLSGVGTVPVPGVGFANMPPGVGGYGYPPAQGGVIQGVGAGAGGGFGQGVFSFGQMGAALPQSAGQPQNLQPSGNPFA